MSADEDTELRDLVAQTLEANGVLGKIRVNMASILIKRMHMLIDIEYSTLVHFHLLTLWILNAGMQRQDFRLSHTWHNLGEGLCLFSWPYVKLRNYFFIKVNRIGTKYLELLANMFNQDVNVTYVTCRGIFTVLLCKGGGAKNCSSRN